MKKILIALAATIALTSAAQADYRRYHGHGGYRNGGGNNWVAPLVGGLIIGGILAGGAYAAQPQPYYYQPVPRYVPQCWTELMGYDNWGRAVYQRVCE
jgi:hypothetical protein